MGWRWHKPVSLRGGLAIAQDLMRMGSDLMGWALHKPASLRRGPGSAAFAGEVALTGSDV